MVKGQLHNDIIILGKICSSHFFKAIAQEQELE